MYISMADILTKEQEFRALVLALQKRNPSWSPSDIANELQSFENPETLSRRVLREKIRRALIRGSIKDKPGRGAKRTVVTKNFKKAVKKLIYLKRKKGQRTVVKELKRKNIRGGLYSVNKAIKEIGLKPFKTRKAQKLTAANRVKRVECAKKLRKKFGAIKNYKWKWNKVVNTDFSGIFTYQPFQNSKNDVVYAYNADEIPSELREAPREKYPKGIMFWGGISSFGLIPKSGPINFTQWLDDQKEDGSRRRVYMTGEHYAKFLREKVFPAVKKVVGNLNNVIWQDDQDKKQRTKVATDTVNEYFEERIEPEDGDAKLADVYPIENVWGMLKEKVRGITFDGPDDLIKMVNKEWKTIDVDKCKEMMEKIPQRLLKVIQNEGNQIYEH